MRESQAARAVLMVRPLAFHSNPQTAATNLLQAPQGAVRAEDIVAARREFDAVVGTLSNAGIEVVTVDPPSGPLPDAVFPNNWISTHADGTVVFYPMHAPNRRLERQPAIARALDLRFRFTVRRTVDLTWLEREGEGEYVEGTGSLVLDRVHRVAYAALSPRTTARGVSEACRTLGYRECVFVASHASGTAIYHTNVMLSVGSEIAIGCFETIRDAGQRDRVLGQLTAMGKQLVQLTEAQMSRFAANVLEVQTPAGPALAVSVRAWDALDVTQRRIIDGRMPVLGVAVDTIERVGGGGLRCMLAEIHLPSRLGATGEAA